MLYHSLSESPVQLEPLNVKSELSHDFAACKCNCNGSTVITPGWLLRYLKIDLMFCIRSVDPQQFANQLSIHSLAQSCRTLERCHVVSSRRIRD